MTGGRRAVLVCPIFPLPEVSGGRKRAVRITEAMQRAGLEVHVLSHGPIGDEAAGAALARGWTVEAFEVDQDRRGIRRWADRIVRPPALTLLRRIEQLAADDETVLVQFEEYHAAPYAVTPLSVPTIYSTYNVDSDVLSQLARAASGRRAMQMRRRALLFAATERAAAKTTTATACVSESDARHFARLASTCLHVPNGVDDDLFTVDPPPAEQRVMFFGHLGYEPNRTGLLRFARGGWPAVLETHPGATLAIVGAGCERPELDEIRDAPGVEVVGLVPDVIDELRRAQLVVAPLWAGGGTRIKVLEALAAGRPVVGTELAVEQIGFVSGEHGLVAETAEALGQSVASLLAEPGLAAQYGQAGRRLSSGYRWADMLTPLEECYRRLEEAWTQTPHDQRRSARFLTWPTDYPP